MTADSAFTWFSGGALEHVPFLRNRDMLWIHLFDAFSAVNRKSTSPENALDRQRDQLSMSAAVPAPPCCPSEPYEMMS